MKNLSKFICISILLLIVISGCNKEELTSQKMLEAKWIITSLEILATTTPGNGSYLIFNSCSSPCTGVDYSASDSTSGTFTYVLNDDATQIVITDTMNAGGNYNFTWDILDLTTSQLKITTSTLLGNLKIVMSKE